ncbi:MAG: hypothetical protein QNJ97_12920 [Myxococcota bacterium]|nr:hypothetical protein [Myxococcota bacterium]
MRSAVWILVSMLVFTGVDASARELTPFEKSLESQGFELIDEDFGVKVYKDPSAEVIRVAAEGRFNHPPEQVLRAVLDYEGQVGVVKRVSESRILKRGSRSLFVYQHLNLPIISDRDYTLHVTWDKSSKNKWVSFRTARTGPGKRRGIVRVLLHQGSWQLKPIAGGKKTLARFQTKIDLGGLLPKWLARAGAGNELPELYANIRKLLFNYRRAGGPCLSKAC